MLPPQTPHRRKPGSRWFETSPASRRPESRPSVFRPGYVSRVFARRDCTRFQSSLLTIWRCGTGTVIQSLSGMATLRLPPFRYSTGSCNEPTGPVWYKSRRSISRMPVVAQDLPGLRNARPMLSSRVGRPISLRVRGSDLRRPRPRSRRRSSSLWSQRDDFANAIWRSVLASSMSRCWVDFLLYVAARSAVFAITLASPLECFADAVLDGVLP